MAGSIYTRTRALFGKLKEMNSLLLPVRHYSQEMVRQRNPRVFFDILIDNEKAGKIIMELFADSVPKTAENFRALCTGEKGIGICGKLLHYKGCRFHYALRNFGCQGGDITTGDGSGGESIYGLTFPDEKFNSQPTSYGTLYMANYGPNTNGSQFFLSTNDNYWVNKHHVVFGRVIKGLLVLYEMESAGTDYGKPRKSIVIEDCGLHVES